MVPSQNVLSLVPQSTVCTCNRRCHGIFRGSPLAGRSLSEESPGRQCYCEGNVGMLPNSSLSCVQSRSSGRSALTRPNKTAGYFVGELQDDVSMTSLAAYSPAVKTKSHPGWLETRPANPELLHLANQSSALQAKFGGCPFRAADHPTSRFKRVQNQSAFRVPQRSHSRRDDDTLRRCRR